MNASQSKDEKIITPGKIERDLIDYLNSGIIKTQSKTDYIFDLLMSHLSKRGEISSLNMYFTEEQLSNIKRKQKELGHDNLNNFVRHVLNYDYIKNSYIPKKDSKLSKIKIVDQKRFKEIEKSCHEPLINGDFASYDRNKRRDQEDFELTDEFHEILSSWEINADFRELDVFLFVIIAFNEDNEVKYKDLIGKSTGDVNLNLIARNDVIYNHVVPDTDSIFYLWLYETLRGDITLYHHTEMFEKNKKNIDSLVQKYIFDNIIDYHVNELGANRLDDIFDEKCINIFRKNKFINI